MFSRVRKGCVGNQGNNPNNVAGWELRPGGMLVQKRNSDTNQTSTASVSTINVKVKYISSYHEIRISYQASFGELKKMLTEHTGLHPQDQKLIFKKKERDSKSYLDVERVKDGSKITLVEDIASRERRMLEMLKKANTEKASKSMAEISLQVDKIAEQVAVLEADASKGGILSEKDVNNLTEMLMTKLIRLDDIVAVRRFGIAEERAGE
ncbi:BAG family molecular chaperone regulator-like protein [Quillaja saponaria]|uniref:BAG family molecular chaperone regulator-like protein n=1 Tax=Quillaja saponaria TaxID=32244 RepID=A0AAD7PE68_QUISA|nr:BAG family molecular chaperone regulator-like protein [Quillaja saponaria]KAJ7952376.1 BAG family molecular chaperone regulator-like protein [Quillaja saponaria]